MYWGDIDTHGLRILAGLRKHFPNVESILMDNQKSTVPGLPFDISSRRSRGSDRADLR